MRPAFAAVSIMPRRAAVSAAAAARVCHSPAARDWRVVTVADGLLRLAETLPAGQSFRWVDVGRVLWHGRDGAVYREWAGVISDAPVVLREPDPPLGVGERPATLFLRVSSDDDERSRRVDEVRDFLRADVDLGPTYERFYRCDATFRTAHDRHPGCRILRQSPTEAVFAFICSSNNNLRRITSMVCYLAETYGRAVGKHEGRPLYAFPSAEVLAQKASEDDLRAAGFGYRAKFVVGTAKALVRAAGDTRVEEHLLALRGRARDDVAKELVALPGVGRKVAGCIALMALDQWGEIPVDTHVWKIAKRYLPELRTKTLTHKVYDRVGDYFRDKFGDHDAGLAHNTLFIGELADFKVKPDSRSTKSSQKRPKSAVSNNDSATLVDHPRAAAAELKPQNKTSETVPKKKKRKTRSSKGDVSANVRAVKVEAKVETVEEKVEVLQPMPNTSSIVLKLRRKKPRPTRKREV